MTNDLRNNPVSNKVCLLYDPQDGRVVHTHRVLVMPGGQDVTDEELEARVKDMAKHAGHDISGLNTLRVAAEDCDGASQYRIDLATKKLQKLERPSGGALIRGRSGFAELRTDADPHCKPPYSADKD